MVIFYNIFIIILDVTHPANYIHSELAYVFLQRYNCLAVSQWFYFIYHLGCCFTEDFY